MNSCIWVYGIAVIGCDEYTFPGTQVVMLDTTATITCVSSGETWQVNCINSTWKGISYPCRE